ncbi:hypothetical protein ACQ4PT_012828 [Festuca glaucescens]
MDRALDEAAEKHASSVAVDVDEGVLRGTVAAAAGTVAPAPATVAAVVNPIAEEEEEEEEPVDEVREGSCILPGNDGEDVDSEGDLRQNVTTEKVTITVAVAPLQLPVDEVPEGSCLLPSNDGEDIKQKKVADDVQVESSTPNATTSKKREYDVGAWMSPEDPGYYSSEFEYDSDYSVHDDNKASFGRRIRTKLEEGDLKIGRVYKLGKEWFTCPFCPNKPDDGLWKALAHHSQSLALYGSTMKIRVQHDVLADFMCGNNRPNVVRHADKKRRVF